MGILYIILGLVVIIKNINIIPEVIEDIIKDSITIKSISTLPIIIGFQRAIFSNEIGMGVTSMIVSLSSENDYIKEAKTQLISTFFITIVICTISSFLILTTNINTITSTSINGIEIINYAFIYHFGSIGKYISSLIVLLFAFSTIITSYYYGDMCLKYLLNNKKSTLSIIIVIIVIVLSSFTKTENAWAIVDIATALTTLINIYALMHIKRKIKEE